jgi:ribosome-associated protein
MNLRDRNFLPEFSFKTSRSSGAGGQHVNKTETKVELIFNIYDSVLLNDVEKERVWIKLSGIINDKGELKISNSESRSQSANKEAVIEKFYQLVEKALKKEKKRIPTEMPVEKKEQILNSKRQHSIKKADRRFNPRDFT